MRKATVIALMLAGSTALATTAQAGGLGIPMDAFLQQFTQTIIGIGWPIGLLGLAGWAAAHLNNVRHITA